MTPREVMELDFSALKGNGLSTKTFNMIRRRAVDLMPYGEYRKRNLKIKDVVKFSQLELNEMISGFGPAAYKELIKAVRALAT